MFNNEKPLRERKQPYTGAHRENPVIAYDLTVKCRKFTGNEHMSLRQVFLDCAGLQQVMSSCKLGTRGKKTAL